MRKISIFLFFFVIVFASLAKTGTNSKEIGTRSLATDSLSKDSDDAERSLTIEIDYGTNRGYQLKTKTAGADTSQTSLDEKYLSPSINYEAASGFYTNIGLYRTPGTDNNSKKNNKWDELYFGIGWDFNISKKAEIEGSLGYMRFAYNKVVKKNGVSPNTNDLTAYIKHDFDFVELKLTGDYYFGGTYSDQDLILDVDHYFYIVHVLSKKDELSVDPMISIIAGTMNYYKERVTSPEIPIPPNATKDQKDKIKKTQSVIQSAWDDLGTFRIVTYEFSLPVNYQIGKFDFEIAWRYNIPTDLPSVLNVSPKAYSYITAYVSFDFLK